MKRFSALATALVLTTSLLAIPVHAQTTTALDAEMAGILGPASAPRLEGIAAIRIHDGREIYHYYGGFRHRKGEKTWPVRADTLFRVASVSKVVTTIGLMELVEQGKVDLDRDVSDYLGFRLRNPSFPDRPILVRMLLDHTSSLRDADGYSFPPGTTLESVLGAAAPVGKSGDHFAHEANRAPGTWFEYCNLGYGIVGTIIERVSGERFDRYMRAHVLGPLKIEGGYNVFALPHPDRLSTLYQRTPQGWSLEYDDWPPEGWTEDALKDDRIGSNATMFSPQGGLRISMPDLAKIARLMIGRGAVDGVRLLKPETVIMMEKPQWTYDGHNGVTGENSAGPFDAYGMTIATLTGWKDASGRGDTPFPGYHGGLRGHLGDAYSLHSGLWYDPAKGDAYVFASTGYPPYGAPDEKGLYSYFTRSEERIFTALSHAGGAADASAPDAGAGGR